MYTLTISADTFNALRADLSIAHSQLCGPSLANTASETEQPTRKPRVKKAEIEPVVVATLALPASTPTPAQTAPVATSESLFGGAQQAPAPVVAVKPTQKDLLTAFRALDKAKGTDPIVALLKTYSVETVIAIPEAKWAEAIAKAEAASK